MIGKPGGRDDSPIRPRRFGDFLDETRRRMELRAEGIEKPIPMPARWEPLSRVLDGGWWQGTYDFVGNTGIGKTQFALQAAIQAVQSGYPVLYISLELEDLQCSARVHGLTANSSWAEMYYGIDKGSTIRGGIPKDAHGNTDHAKIKETLAEYGAMYGWPLYFEGPKAHGFYFEDIGRYIAGVRKDHPDNDYTLPVLVIIDFLQLLTSHDATLSLREVIRGASYEAVAAAHKYNASVILLSSTARDNYWFLDDNFRSDEQLNMKRPGEGSPMRYQGVGKESGEIEYSATNLGIFTHNSGAPDKKGRYFAETEKGGKYLLALAKRRMGAPIWIEFEYEPVTGRVTFTKTTQGYRRIKRAREDDTSGIAEIALPERRPHRKKEEPK